jgi:hypothetical protein
MNPVRVPQGSGSSDRHHDAQGADNPANLVGPASTPNYKCRGGDPEKGHGRNFHDSAAQIVRSGKISFKKKKENFFAFSRLPRVDNIFARRVSAGLASDRKHQLCFLSMCALACCRCNLILAWRRKVEVMATCRGRHAFAALE